MLSMRKKELAKIFIGTSGWHYEDWLGTFYPEEIKGYHELEYHAKHFNSVENNASFYRISKESTYKTWDQMTPKGYTFSLKLNKTITHMHRLELTDEVKEKTALILSSLQVLQTKLGAMVIQLPPNFRYDIEKLDRYLQFFQRINRNNEYRADVAIEFRNKHWFTGELYDLLRSHNVSLVASQSSRYPIMRKITADIAYIRMHGPEKLFSSSYSTEQLQEWAMYMRSIQSDVSKIYIYFNNDFHGYAIHNALELQRMLK